MEADFSWLCVASLNACCDICGCSTTCTWTAGVRLISSQSPAKQSSLDHSKVLLFIIC